VTITNLSNSNNPKVTVRSTVDNSDLIREVQALRRTIEENTFEPNINIEPTPVEVVNHVDPVSNVRVIVPDEAIKIIISQSPGFEKKTMFICIAILSLVCIVTSPVFWGWMASLIQ